METDKKLQKLLSNIAARRERSEELLHGACAAKDLVYATLQRQRVYLLWTAALAAVHLLEIWILIRFHFAFPPLTGLNVLRILSSLSLIGLFSALAFRGADFESRIGALNPSTLSLRLTRIRTAARFILLIGLFASCAIALWVICYSKLELSSPPAFRAVIVSGILSLPFDVAANFLLYVGGIVAALPISRRFRLYSLLSVLASLVFLALDLPFGYLLLSLSPRFFLLRAAWRSITGEPLQSLFPKAASELKESLSFFRSFKNQLLKNLFTQIAFDMGFLLLFSRLSRFEQSLSLLLYAAHKSAHLSMVLFGKSHMSFSSEIKTARLIGERGRVTNILSSLLMLSVLYAVLGFSFAPLFLLQRQTQQWLSPTGELLSFDGPLLLFGFLAALNCFASHVGQTLANHTKTNAVVAAAITFLILAVFLQHVSPSLVYVFRVREVLLLLTIVHFLFAFGVLALGARGLFIKHKEINVGDSGTALPHQFFQAIANSCEYNLGIFLFVFFKEQNLHGSRILEYLSPLRAPEDTLTLFGARSAFLLKPGSNHHDIEEFRTAVLRNLAGHLEEFKYLLQPCSDVFGVLRKLFQSEDPMPALYKLGSGRMRAAASKDSDTAALLLKEWLETQSAHLIEQLGALEISAYSIENGFAFNQMLAREKRKNARRFLRALYQQQNFLEPDTAQGPELGGFLHLNRGCRPVLLLWIPAKKRETFAALRFEVFRLNVADALSHGMPLKSKEDLDAA